MVRRNPTGQETRMQFSTDPHGLDTRSEVERGAYNRAFSELGLEWYWDASTYRELKACAGDRNCVQAYIEANHPHLLQAYDSGFLAEAIDSVRGRL
jgi:hypothetical protein